MSFQKALITNAHSSMVAAKVQAKISHEITKGCTPHIIEYPVALEPRFQPIWENATEQSQIPDQYVLEQPLSENDLIRKQIWISPEHEFDWHRSESFIKMLESISHRIGFEIAGNCREIMITFLCSKFDLPVIETAFKSAFEYCELSDSFENPLACIPDETWNDIYFRDFLPHPPYYNLFTMPSELVNSPLRSAIIAISDIEFPATGFYQVLFEPVSSLNNHHKQIEILLDIEYRIKLNSGFHSHRYSQQAPSGALQHMAMDLERKAHNDKPFFSAALRTGVAGAGNIGKSISASIAVVANQFQHGGRPLLYIDQDLYKQHMSHKQIREMFLQGRVYRPGFLLNSCELTGLVHILPLKSDEHRHIPIQTLETLRTDNPDLLSGTFIGSYESAGQIIKIHIPENPRGKGVHSIGRSGSGKSTTQEYLILSDIEQGHGVAVIDPHNDLVDRLLRLIGRQHLKRIIYLDFGDPDYVPLWNPLARIDGQDVGRTVNDAVKTIESFVAKGGWGDRLENILRSIIYAFMNSSNATFLNVSNALRNKSEKSKALRKELLSTIDNETVKQFWLHDYEKYSKSELSPPINKLSKLLTSGASALMLSQPENRLNFREIMDNGMILLVNLSNVDLLLKQVLGCFLLTTFHLTALTRSDLPADQRKQFHIHCDEAHQFVTDSLENLISETRKYGVSLNLAHQYLNQFGTRKTDALSTIGSTIIFNVNTKDANYLIRDLQNKVSVKDIVSLKTGEAIARIGTDIVRIKTSPPMEIPAVNYRDQIIERSRRLYYKPVQEVRSWLNKQGSMGTPAYASSRRKAHDKKIKEYFYDEF